MSRRIIYKTALPRIQAEQDQGQRNGRLSREADVIVPREHAFNLAIVTGGGIAFILSIILGAILWETSGRWDLILLGILGAILIGSIVGIGILIWLSWKFIGEHRQILGPLIVIEAPDPKLTHRAREKRIRIGIAEPASVDDEQFDTDLWWFLKEIWQAKDRPEYKDQASAWSLRKWVGIVGPSGLRVSKNRYFRLLEELIEAKIIVGRRMGKAGDWNPRIETFEQAARLLGFEEEVREG